MRISINQLLFSIAVTFLVLPIVLPSSSWPFSHVSQISLTGIQVCCGIYMLVVAKQVNPRSLRDFWRYLGFAVLLFFVNSVMLVETPSEPGYLTSQFVILFSYFFLFIAIETNPHLHDLPLSKYISGRVPAVLFCVVCFSYFVLIPLEFSNTAASNHQTVVLFNIILLAIITVKLCLGLIHSKDRRWQYMYSLLALAFALILMQFVSSFSLVHTPILQHTLTLFPYLAMMAAAYVSLAIEEKNTLIKTDVHHETHILLLMLMLTAVHIYGSEHELFYVTQAIPQSVVVLIWLLLGSLMVMGIIAKKRKQKNALKKDLSFFQGQSSELAKANKTLESDLVNSEEKAIVGVSNNAILTTTIDGVILSANPAAVQMFQALEHELLGTKVSNLFAQQDEMHYFFDFESNVYSLQRKETGISVECSSVRSDKTEFPAQAELQWAEREERPLIVITFINLSARKLAEKQALELKDKFIANISHEFRTPLTIINGIIDGYLRHATDSNEISDLTTAKRNGLRLVRMVEQLLELSRLSDNPKLNLATYRLTTLMSMPIESFSRLANQSELEFVSEIPKDIWLECDPQAFEKVIFNLLANAVKYTRSGGAIQVNAYVEQDTIILDVIDSGIGISKENQDKIFERFQRADDPSNQSVFGVGIGLSLVNELVKAHGWRISLASDPGYGSKFTLSMPIANAQQEEGDLPIGLTDNEVSSLLSQQVKVENPTGKRPDQVVLVIEDNADMQSHIKQVVEQQHHCILAGSGELGLELAEEYIPDLIVCDLMLTGIDGFEVLKQIKSNELTAHIPVILLTARSDLESRLQGLNLNADEYLSKPFNQQELLTRIQNLIDSRKHLQQRYLEIFNKEKKEERRTVSHNNAAKMTEAPDSMTLDEKFLAKLEKLIATHYTEPGLDIAFIANELAMSERQLQRKMKVMLDITPNNFIKEFRLKKASELLRSGAQIGRIALDVGFSSQTYFGRCFKETFNCTPKQYQQKLSQEND